MTWEGINQRKFPRVNYKCLIRVSKSGREEIIDTFTENIGSGGICVVLEKDFGLFERVKLEIFLGDELSPITCEGSIVWVVKRHATTKQERDRFDTGIEFQDILDDDRDRINRLVQDILNAET